MPPAVYLDTPIITEIDKVTEGQAGAQVTVEEAKHLKEAIRGGKISVPPSLVVLVELIDAVEKDRVAVVRRLRIMRDLLGGFHGMLNHPSALLRERVRSYAEATSPPTITLPEEDRRAIVSVLSEVCAGSTRFDEALMKITGGVGVLKEEAKASMEKAQADTLAEVGWESRGTE